MRCCATMGRGPAGAQRRAVVRHQCGSGADLHCVGCGPGCVVTWGESVLGHRLHGSSSKCSWRCQVAQRHRLPSTRRSSGGAGLHCGAIARSILTYAAVARRWGRVEASVIMAGAGAPRSTRSLVSWAANRNCDSADRSRTIPLSQPQEENLDGSLSTIHSHLALFTLAR